MDIEYVGDIENWMDMRDMLIRSLEQADTELQFNKILLSGQ